MHRLITLSALLAVLTVGGCAAASNDPADEYNWVRMNQRHNPTATATW
jgi:hypothetical protein